jgi:N-acetylglucosaminyldiphosphoundecaprenol N-acetyl-beta-D-mannosaminyltransferase
VEKYFKIKFEFNRVSFKNEIIRSINHKRKGYVCIVDGNVLAHVSKSENYRNIINNSIVNSCDGSSISLIAGLIHKKKLQTYTGPEIFEDFVNLGFSQFFLGNTDDVLVKLKSKLIQRKIYFSDNDFFSLPFKEVNDFDYLLAHLSKKYLLVSYCLTLIVEFYLELVLQ